MLAAALALATLVTGALAAPFSVPADDARWTITPRYMRALDVFHGVGCLAGSSGLVMSAGVRAELLFNGTGLRLTGIAPPLDTQILLDGEPLPLRPPFEPGAAACVPFAEWQALDARTVHNLTIVAPATGRFDFLIATATGTAPEPEPASASASAGSLSVAPTSSPLPDSSSSPAAQAQLQSDTTSSAAPPPSRSPHPGLLIAAVLGPLALFLAAGFALYFYRSRTRNNGLDAKTDGAAAAVTRRSRSFKGDMHETQFVMVPATVRPDRGR